MPIIPSSPGRLDATAKGLPKTDELAWMAYRLPEATGKGQASRNAAAIGALARRLMAVERARALGGGRRHMALAHGLEQEAILVAQRYALPPQQRGEASSRDGPFGAK